MAINGHHNKPFGPGGGTRRLHQKLIITLKSKEDTAQIEWKKQNKLQTH